MESNDDAQGRTALGADLVIPALALAFAAYFFYSVRGLAWEAQANGLLIGSALVVLCLVQVGRIARAVAKRHGRLGFGSLIRPREAFVKRLGIVAISVAFLVAIRWLGLTLSLFLAMAGALYVMGGRTRRHLFWIPLISAAMAYVLFIGVLQSELPPGPVEHLLAPVVAKLHP